MKEQKTIKCTRCCAEIKAKTNEKVLKCSICGREYENPYYIDKTTQTKGKRENATQRNFIKDFVLDEEVYSSKKKKYTVGIKISAAVTDKITLLCIRYR